MALNLGTVAAAVVAGPPDVMCQVVMTSLRRLIQ